MSSVRAMRSTRSPSAIGRPIHSVGSSSSTTPSCGASTRERSSWRRRAVTSARRSSMRPPSSASWARARGSPSACCVVWRSSVVAVARACCATSSRLWITASSKPNSGAPLRTSWLGCTWKTSMTPSIGARTTVGWRGTSSPGASTDRRTGHRAATARPAAAHTPGWRQPRRRRGRAPAVSRPQGHQRRRGDARRSACSACHQASAHSCHSPSSCGVKGSSRASSSPPAAGAGTDADPPVPRSGAGGSGSHSACAGHQSAQALASSGGRSPAVKAAGPGRAWPHSRASACSHCA